MTTYVLSPLQMMSASLTKVQLWNWYWCHPTEALPTWGAHMWALSTAQAARCSFEGLVQQQLSLFLGIASNSRSNDKEGHSRMSLMVKMPY